MKQACTEEDFLKHTAMHFMEIVRDDGIYRHLRFRRPGTSVYWYDLHTWPGALCIDGDCGTFVFRRLQDMFEFFRADRGIKDNVLYINPYYWSEKCVSSGGRKGLKEWSVERFHARVKDHFETDFEEESDAVKSRAWDEITTYVLAYGDSDYEAYNAINQFSFETPDGKLYRFRDFWDGGECSEYTFDFLWCCYAIAQGVKRYDAVKAAEREPVAG